MDAKEFYILFQKELQNSIEEARTAWTNKDAFTKYISNLIQNNILGKKYTHTEREYFRIDIIAYVERKDELSSPPKSAKRAFDFHKHLWDLAVAVEHENADTSWMDEVIKLAHIACPLRVVIGYLPEEENKSDYLEYVHKAINMLGVSDIAERGDFLLILGNSRCGNNGGICVYSPYIYKKEGFLPLE